MYLFMHREIAYQQVEKTTAEASIDCAPSSIGFPLSWVSLNHILNTGENK